MWKQTWWISGTGLNPLQSQFLSKCSRCLLQRWHLCRCFFNKSTKMTAVSFKASRQIFVWGFSCSHLSVSPKGNSSECESRKRLRATETDRETSTPIYCAQPPPSHNCTPTLIHFIVLSLIKPLLCLISRFTHLRRCHKHPPSPRSHAAFQGFWECQHLPRLRCGTTATLLFLIQAKRFIFSAIWQLVCFYRIYVGLNLPVTLFMLSAPIQPLYDPEIRIPRWVRFSNWWLPDCIFLRWHHPVCTGLLFFGLFTVWIHTHRPWNMATSTAY